MFEKYEYAKEHSLIFTSTANIMTMYLLAELIFKGIDVKVIFVLAMVLLFMTYVVYIKKGRLNKLIFKFGKPHQKVLSMLFSTLYIVLISVFFMAF